MRNSRTVQACKGGQAVENQKIASQAYSETGSIKALEQKIAVTGKEAKQTVRNLESRIKDLAEIIKYAEQYKANKPYNIAYKKSKNPDSYFRKHESQIIIYGSARHMLKQTGLNLKSLNIDKLKTEYQELTAQKKELTATYKNCEKEEKSLKQKLENLNQYLGQTEPLKSIQEQPDHDTPLVGKRCSQKALRAKSTVEMCITLHSAMDSTIHSFSICCKQCCPICTNFAFKYFA